MRLSGSSGAIAAAGLAAMLAGCAVVRGLDDAVAPVLGQVPVLRAIGIQARAAATSAPAPAPEAPRSPAAGATSGAASRQMLRLVLCTAAWINPNARGEAAPVRIRIVELQVAHRFSAMPAAQLFATDRAALGADVRDFQDVVVAPGSMLSVGWLASPPGTLGIAADFRDPVDGVPSHVLLPLDGTVPAAEWVLHVQGTALHLLRAPATPATCATTAPPSPTSATP